MKKTTVFSWLSSATGFMGIGMVLGYSLGNSASNTPLWLGGILILLGAITLGMTISSRDQLQPARSEDENDTTKSQ